MSLHIVTVISAKRPWWFWSWRPRWHAWCSSRPWRPGLPAAQYCRSRENSLQPAAGRRWIPQQLSTTEWGFEEAPNGHGPIGRPAQKGQVRRAAAGWPIPGWVRHFACISTRFPLSILFFPHPSPGFRDPLNNSLPPLTLDLWGWNLHGLEICIFVFEDVNVN